MTIIRTIPSGRTGTKLTDKGYPIRKQKLSAYVLWAYNMEHSTFGTFKPTPLYLKRDKAAYVERREAGLAAQRRHRYGN